MLALVLTVLASLQDAKPLEQVQTIPLPKVEGRIDHLAFDAKAGRLAVAALGNNTVEIIDVSQGKGIHRLDGFQEPQGVLCLDGRIVVASGGDGSCRFYDGDSFKLVKTTDCKSDADNIRYDSDSKRVYVGYGSGALAQIDPEKGTKVGDIPLDGHPESFQLEARGKRIFINVPRSGSVVVADREKRAVIAIWKPSAQSNFPMALDEDGRRLYVGCRVPSKLVVFDIDNGKESAAVDCSGDTDDVFVDAKGKRVYVSCGAGFLDVFDVAEGAPRRIARMPTATGARTCLFVPETGKLYLAVPHRDRQQAEVRVYQAKP